MPNKKTNNQTPVKIQKQSQSQSKTTSPKQTKSQTKSKTSSPKQTKAQAQSKPSNSKQTKTQKQPKISMPKQAKSQNQSKTTIQNQIEVQKQPKTPIKSQEQPKTFSQTKIPNETSKSKKPKLLLLLLPLIILIILIPILILSFLKIQKPLSAPQDIILHNPTLRTVNLTWNNDNLDNNYLIVYSSNPFEASDIYNQIINNQTLDNTFQTIEVFNKQELEINNLNLNTDYYFCILSYHETKGHLKYSLASPVSHIKTSNLEIAEVSNLAGTDITTNSLKLTWDEYTTTVTNKDLTPVNISYSLYNFDSNAQPILIKENISEPFYELTNLDSFTQYSYAIQANILIDNEELKGPLSNKVTLTTLIPPITNLKATSSSSSTIKVTWDPLKLNSISDSSQITYTLYGSDKKDTNFTIIADNLTTTSFNETKLKASTTRYYYVIAKVNQDNQIFESPSSSTINAKTKAQTSTSNPNNSSNNNTNSNNNSSSNNNNNNNGNSNNTNDNNNSQTLTKKQKEEQARVIAKQIAASITGTTDLEKVSQAAQIVSQYYYRGVHKESGPDYATAYGVFIKGESSCAGTTRALGMVLEEMGYKWQHKNENLWTHQWVILEMDGQIGYADGQVGWAGYGKHPIDNE